MDLFHSDQITGPADTLCTVLEHPHSHVLKSVGLSLSYHFSLQHQIMYISALLKATLYAFDERD